MNPIVDTERLMHLVRRMETIELEWQDFRQQMNSAITSLRMLSNTDYQNLRTQLAGIELTFASWREAEAKERVIGQRRAAIREWVVIAAVFILAICMAALAGARYL